MKKKLKNVSVLLLIASLGSCTITKRQHRSGYHIEKRNLFAYSLKNSVSKKATKKIDGETPLIGQSIIAEDDVNKTDFKVKSKPKLKGQIEKLTHIKVPVLQKEEAKSVVSNKKNVASSEVKYLQKEKSGKVEIGEKEIWSYMGLIFTILMALFPLFIGVPALIYSVKGLKSNKRKMSRWTLVITILLFLLMIISWVNVGMIYFQGLYFVF